jgi:hypothetical protein
MWLQTRVRQSLGLVYIFFLLNVRAYIIALKGAAI